jgi:ATP-dependent helicase HrpA
VFQDSQGNSDPDDSSSASDYLDGIVKALDELATEPQGDTLVFLSGESEIRDAQEALQGRITAGLLPKGTEILPLYGRLSSAEQHKVFERSKMAGMKRRVILATNVALVKKVHDMANLLDLDMLQASDLREMIRVKT